VAAGDEALVDHEVVAVLAAPDPIFPSEPMEFAVG